MTSASQWRMSLAHTLTKEYATLPQVIAAFVGGSTARQQVFYYRRPQWEESPPLGILPSPLDAP